MEFGTGIRTVGLDPKGSVYQQIEEAALVTKKVSTLAFTHTGVPQHWLSGDLEEVWLQPLPVLARMAPVSGNLKLVTNIIQMPLYNPVDIAEQVSTMDHISNGRFVLGLGNGYRELELEAAGTNRRERAPRVEESIEIMKRLWAGEDLDFKGRFWNVKGRMALTPVQKPGPPIWIAVHAEGAARRAARLAEGALLAPQVYLDDLKRLAAAYEDECAKVGRRGTLGLSRPVSVSKDGAKAHQAARAATLSHVKRYGSWNMQEKGMADIHLDPDGNDTLQYVIAGTPEECVEQISRYKEELNLDFMGCAFPAIAGEGTDLSAKLEYLQMVSEEVIAKVK